jgi:hypothetical protein
MNKELLDDVSLEEAGHTYTNCNGLHKLLRMPSRPANSLSAGLELADHWYSEYKYNRAPCVLPIFIIMGMCMIAFIVVSCIALVRSNTSTVVDACGQALWNTFLSSFIFRCIQVYFFFTKINKDKYTENMYADTVIIRFMLMGAACTLCVFQGIYFHQGLGNKQCGTALEEESKFGSPLLLHVGIVGLAVDAVMVLFQIVYSFNQCTSCCCVYSRFRWYFCGWD